MNFTEQQRKQIGFLQDLCNKHGDFLISSSLPNEGWTKHKSVLWCWENFDKEAWRLATATHRSLLKNEIAFDFDPEKNETKEELQARVKKASEELRQKSIKAKVFFTGNKGYHIHMQFYEAISDDFKKWLINHFRADVMLANKNHMIALEGAPHRKTGNPKEEVQL